MSSAAQKRNGYPNKSNPETTTTQTFCVTIPDGVEYRNALYSQLTNLGKWWSWQREDTGEKAKLSANTWRSLFLLEEECPVDCAEVEACLETSDIISGLNDGLDTVTEDAESLGGGTGYKTSSPTKPIGQAAKYTTKIAANIVTPTGGCNDADKDMLWGAITTLVFYAHARNQEVLNSMATMSSTTDGYTKLTGFLPMIASMTTSLALDLITKLATNFATSYNSAVTQSFLYGVCSDLFCAASSCNFSIENLMDYCASHSGGTYNASVNTFLDVSAALAGQSTGSGIFNAMTWWQFQSLGLSEKFASSMNIDNLCLYAQTASPDSGWQLYATACYTHSGAFTLVLDFAGDYVKSGSEVVIRNAQSLLTQVSGTAAALTQAYARGLIYTNTGSQGVVKRISITNAATVTDISANVRKVSGTASSVGILFTSNTYSGQPRRQFSSSTFAYTTAVPLFNVGGTPGTISRFDIDLNTTLASQTCVAEIRYIKITGTGILPTFA